MPQEPPCTPADPVQSDWPSAVPHSALCSQSLHLLPPPAHRGHSWDLGYTFPAAPVVGMVEFWHQEPPMSNPLSELILVPVFSVWNPLDQDAAAARAVSQGDGHGPAAPLLPSPGSHHLPSCSSAASSPGPISCTDWIFIINF